MTKRDRVMLLSFETTALLSGDRQGLAQVECPCGHTTELQIVLEPGQLRAMLSGVRCEGCGQSYCFEMYEGPTRPDV